jgi:DNA-binding response OmpR family regulator
MKDPIGFERVLLLEDDRNLALTLGVALKRLGLQFKAASTLKKARELIESEKPDLLLLDRSVPDGDGLDLCSQLREQYYTGSILMLSAAGDLSSRVKGLNRGADDYLAKPFAWEELEARIRALGRRSLPKSGATGWRLDETRLRVCGDRGWVQLTPLEFKLISHLMRAEGAIVSREELLKDVWGFSLLPKTRTVDFFLSRLRKQLEKDAENPRHLLTVRGAGYRFEASPSLERESNPSD